MHRVAALTNYYSNLSALESFWCALRRRLVRAGLQDLSERLSWPTELLAHWRDPALFWARPVASRW